MGGCGEKDLTPSLALPLFKREGKKLFDGERLHRGMV
jgi:hypothetical protein